MSVKICGHEIRWQKPIKIYTLTRHICVLLTFVLVCAPVMASDDLDAARCALVAPASGLAAIDKPTPRPAVDAMQLSPAHALALALGVRNVAGPMEKSTMHYSPRTLSKNPPASSRQAIARASDDPSSPDGCQASLVPQENRPPRLAMQR